VSKSTTTRYRRYLEEKAIACLLLDRSLDAEGIGHSEIVSNDLDAALLGEVSPGLPVVLIEGVLDGDNRVLGDESEVVISQFLTCNPLGGIRVGVFEVQVIFAIFVELGRGHVQSNLDLPLIAGLLDGFSEELEGLFCARHVGSEATLVTDISCCRIVGSLSCKINFQTDRQCHTLR
jgi:hypothetical protein